MGKKRYLSTPSVAAENERLKLKIANVTLEKSTLSLKMSADSMRQRIGEMERENEKARSKLTPQQQLYADKYTAGAMHELKKMGLLKMGVDKSLQEIDAMKRTDAENNKPDTPLDDLSEDPIMQEMLDALKKVQGL